jgi:phage gp29-like protein
MLPGLSTLTPAYIEMLLRQGFSGSWTQVWDLFQLMEDTWPRLAHNLETLKREVCDMQWSLEPWVEKGKDVTPEAEERAMVVQACLDACHPDPADEGETDFNGLKFDLLDAWGKGLSVAEVLWTHGDAGGVPDLTFPVAFRWAHPKHYTMGSDGRLGRTDPATKSVIPFEPDQWIIAKSKGKTGHLNYAARLRALAWWWCASNFSSDWLLNLAQVFGLPFRWANYDPAAGETTVERVCQMLENMGSAGWAAFPAGTTMELVESSKGGPGTTPQDNIMDRADKQCDILLLGQTLTTEGGSSGGNRALGQVHESSRDKKIKAASQWLAAIVNRQLIPSILTLNYGDTSMAPHFNPNFQE